MSSKTIPIGGDIELAARLIREGKLVAFPTETVYGLGGDATNPKSAQEIYAVKGRPSNNPLIVHVSSFSDLLACADLSALKDPDRTLKQLEALNRFWPGPLSVVLPKAKSIASEVCAGGKTVGLRIPDHHLALALIKACGKPIAAPSANPSNYISPTTAKHVTDNLSTGVAYVLDGGPCRIGVESTVLSLVNETPTILRLGGITQAEIEAALAVRVAVRSTTPHTGADAPAPSPGMLAKHYSPKTPVMLLASRTAAPLVSAQRVGVILFSQNRELGFKPSEITILSESGELSEVAARLFAALRELDAQRLDLILVDTCEPIGLGAAIMDRLIRAVG